MFAKRLFQKVTNNLSPSSSSSSQTAESGSVAQADLDPRIDIHYGIPSTGSLLAFDPVQRLMAIGTLDGRIKVIGGDNVEGLLISPKQLPYKNLEFLDNKGFLVSISSENDIQVWDLEQRHLACSLQWDSNVTAFSVIHGTYFMYVGDEWGLISVLMYNVDEGKVLQLPYHIPAESLAEAAGISTTNQQCIVGLLPQPSASETRLLVAYEKGLIVLWDVGEARVVLTRGCKDLKLSDREVGSPKGLLNEDTEDIAGDEEEEREISSLCWASSDGSILAVGYVNGDILLWNMSRALSSKGQQSGFSSNDVVKLQLSSGEKRLPVIVLHWSPCSRTDDGKGGQLFIYGGDEIGSEEVLTVLTLGWSSGIETLQCVGRVDLTLDGSFSDLILVPNAETTSNPSNTLFVLTNLGQLRVYDDAILLALSSQQEKEPSIPVIRFPVLIPTVDPHMTVAKLSSIPLGESSSKTLLEMTTVMKNGATRTMSNVSKWPLTGGVPSKTLSLEDNGVEKLYMAGYQDGSVRIWDSTSPSLSLMFVLEGQIGNIEVAGASASVSALDFCSQTLSLAVGNEHGLVRVYKLGMSSGEMELHITIESKREVDIIHQEKGLQCTAVFFIVNSPVQTLQYTDSGAKLAIGFGCGRVGMLDMGSLSVLFLTDSLSHSSSPIVSLIEKESLNILNLINDPKHVESIKLDYPADILFILTRDSHVVVVNSATGTLIFSRPAEKESLAVSMYIVGSSSLFSEVLKDKHPEQLSQNGSTQVEPIPPNNLIGDAPTEITLDTSSETKISAGSSTDSLLLLCCEDTLHLFSLASLLKEDNSCIRKVSLAKRCCWTAIFRSKDEKAGGLVLLYQTGLVEIRSFPDLEVVSETSLMSILRWSFNPNMEKTICSSDNGQICLVNGCEVAFISLLACENSFRFLESLSSLHDKVLAAAADEAFNFSANQNKKQGTSPGILGGIIKGIRGEKLKNAEPLSGTFPNNPLTLHLEAIFSKAPFPDPSEAIKEALELNIDDIEIDEPVRITLNPSHQGKSDKKGKESEREKLFQGVSADTKPRLRDPEEIKAKYRKTGDASAAASQARDKLIQRQEKLERLSRHTAELQSGAENFASMANELAKTMEGRKWWKI